SSLSASSSLSSQRKLETRFKGRVWQKAKQTPTMAMSSFAREIDAVLDAAEGKKPEELLITYKGLLYPSVLCCAETFQALDTMKVRKDDVFLATYPKCGTNWIEHILNDLTSAVLREEVPRTKHLQILEFGVPEKFQ
ncbi:unnamed protein product, partial [Lepidochelys olivacea]